MIQEIIGECRGGTAVGAAGDIAPTIVTAGVGLPRLVRAGGTTGVETGQLVGLAVAVEILLLRPTATERPLPQLIQVRVDIAVVVTGSAQASIGEITNVPQPIQYAIRNFSGMYPHR